MSLKNSKSIGMGLTFVLAAGVLSTMSGCTDDEVVASALVIGAAAIISDDSPPPRRHDTVIIVHEDHRGRGRDHGRGGWGGRRDDRRDDRRHDLAGAVQSSALDAAAAAASNADVAATSTSASAAAFKSADKRVTALAKRYAITEYSATYAARAILMAQAKDTAGIEALGLTVGDFKQVYEGKTLEAAKVETAAAAMKMKPAAAANFFANLSADVQAEKAARGL